MSILRFLTQAQLDDLDEDPSTAFMTIVNLAQRSLDEQTSHLNSEDRDDWQVIERKRLSFMNVVLATAKNYEIEPFYSMEVPKLSNFNQQEFQQFEHDVDHYLTQLVLSNSLRSRRNSVEILPKSKDSIRTYVHNLRDCLESANMDDKKRKALLKKLDDFEKELEKRRTSLLAVTLFTFELMALPGGVWASYEIASKLINNVMQSVAEAKAEETERNPQLAAPPEMKALMPPRPPAVPARSQRRQSFADDLDEDVPF